MKINGKEMPTKWGINQCELFCELRGISLKQYYELLADFETGNYTFGAIRDLIYTALKDGARQAGEQFTATNLDVGDWMDTDPAKYIAEALTELVETLPKPTDNGTAKKKKARPQPSKT
jgi:hypothetical protein